jgi:pimeloyl-ACP methyl ester carboxylesterase
MSVCADSCPAIGCPSPHVDLASILHRFEHEAVRGVCDTGRYRCPYFTWGAGPPLLLIPGLSGDARSFLLLSAYLADHFRCITYDFPCGGSDCGRLDRLSHADLVADVFALLDHVGAPQSYIYATSFGSTLALAALRMNPYRLPRVVLQGGFARRRLAPAEVALARLARHWQAPLRQVPFFASVQRRLHRGPFNGAATDVWNFFLTRCGSAGVAAVAQRALLMHEVDLRPHLPAIRTPILLVCGDEDPLVDRSCEDELLQGLPNVGRVELPGCGHYPRFTQPAVLAEVVHRFLTPQGAD